jgi:hypothetical protein
VTLVSCLVVTAVVWTVSLIGPVRWRAFVYSLPLPITVVLATTPVVLDGSQLVGVVGLVSFFAVVALGYGRLGWPIAVADAAGALWYVGLASVTAALGPVPVWPALAVVCALWTAAVLAGRRRADGPAGLPAGVPAGVPARRMAPLVKLVVMAGAALAVVALGGLLAGMVVTFPYAGVLVAVDSRHDLGAFTRHFAVNSIGLVAFLTVAYLVAPHGRAAAIGVGWLAFAVCALVLQAARRPRVAA